MRRLLTLLLCLTLIGCNVENPPQPKPKEPELAGFIVRRCTGDECLKGLLKTLSDKVGCAVLGMSTTYECNYRCIGGIYVHTVIAECPTEQPVLKSCKDDGGVNVP